MGVILIAAGYILYWNSTSSITPVLGNVKGTFTGIEYSNDTPLLPHEVVSVRPVINNTGSVPMYCFVKVDIPFSTVDGETVEWYVAKPATGWTQINRTVNTDTVSYVFAYESNSTLTPLDANASTDSLFEYSEGCDYNDNVLFVGPVGLLSEEQRSESRSVVFTAYGSQTGGDISNLSDTAVFEAIQAEIGSEAQP